MNATPKITATLAFFALMGFAAGCSSPSSTVLHPHPACSAAVAALPEHPPETEKQALADELAVDRVRSKDNMLVGMAHIVGFSLHSLGLAIARGRNTSAARAGYNADVTVLKSYCQALSKYESRQ
jgi:hypothetical protein